MIPFDYIRASTTKDAVLSKAKNRSAQYIAGGTNLVDLMKKSVSNPEILIDVSRLALKEITADAKGILIGAMVTNSDAAENATITKQFPLLSMALSAGASAQLRNAATMGGNMMQRTRCGYFYDVAMACNKREAGTGCPAIEGQNRMHAVFGTSENCIAVHPSDMCVALAALDATVHVQGTKTVRTIPFTEFHTLPGTTPQTDNSLQANELITAVHLPVNKLNRFYYLKIRDRSSYAFALVSVAVALEVSNGLIRTAKLAMGGVAHKPWRLTAVEQFLKGKTADSGTFIAAANMAMDGAKGFGHNDFKIKMGRAAVQEALEKAATTNQ